MSSVTDGREKDNRENPALIIFSPSWIRQLSTQDGRLEPTYIGIRRIRPSSQIVQKALLKTTANITTTTDKETLLQEKTYTDHDYSSVSSQTKAQKQTSSDVVFKVTGEDGMERRMTNQEKKALKQKLQKEKTIAKKQNQQQELMKTERKRTRNEIVCKFEGNRDKKCPYNHPRDDHLQGKECSSYHYGRHTEHDLLQLDESKNSWVQQELADLRGERALVPPVIVSPPLARSLLGAKHPQETQYHARIDDNLAQEWALALKQSMLPAEQTRQMEDIRTMAYHLIPEVWTRFRPGSLSTPSSSESGPISQSTCVSLSKQTTETFEVHPQRDNSWGQNQECELDAGWRFVQMRPLSCSSFDNDLAAVVKVLYHNSSLHFSCGAKFGCDLLLYDGPRSERHAFAGLRLINHTGAEQTDSFPVPSAYCMAGYVRTLNTAAKLALLAYVCMEEQTDGTISRRVAFVDLRLERADGSNRKSLEERMQKLQKARTAPDSD